MVKPTFGPRTAPATPEQGSAATVAHGHKRAQTLELSQAEGNQLFLILLHGLAGLTETINPSVTTTNGLERSTVRQQAMVGGGGHGQDGAQQHFFFFPLRKSTAVEKQTSLHIFPGGWLASERQIIPIYQVLGMLMFSFSLNFVWSFPWKTWKRCNTTTLGMQMWQVMGNSRV